MSIPELAKELLRDLKYTTCKAKPVDSRNLFGTNVKVYFVECTDPDGHVRRAVVPDLQEFSAKLKLPVLLEE